ncbi:Protein of unknown function (DUF3261) [Shewanella psychrophila]|uniref:DUF3261 domain-containing protein n=1 Tax=Shewanella psychrophila TaxID=225848 RepID=A0A1S6HSE5_9GAMM|nr:DUF3261 domain-containing protein [Shewanella psychrophila]AQS38477.1 Protein of unknown function (DUF3261) [Shewanella psychrophila]
MNSLTLLTSLKHKLKTVIAMSAIIPLAFILSACSQTFQRQTCVALAKEVNYCLAPIPLDETNQTWVRSATQKAGIKVDAAQHELMTQVEIDANELTLVGLAPLGQALFTLIYDGNTLTSEQSVLLGGEFKAEYLLALIQLIYWPEDTVNTHLQGAKLTSSDCGASRCRKIYAIGSNPSINVNTRTQNDSIVNIEYSHDDPWQAEIDLKIPQAKFELTLTPI